MSRRQAQLVQRRAEPASKEVVSDDPSAPHRYRTTGCIMGTGGTRRDSRGSQELLGRASSA
jgi:hypothetical protein